VIGLCCLTTTTGRNSVAAVTLRSTRPLNLAPQHHALPTHEEPSSPVALRKKAESAARKQCAAVLTGLPPSAYRSDSTPLCHFMPQHT
jgi:hypothetical protein